MNHIKSDGTRLLSMILELPLGIDHKDFLRATDLLASQFSEPIIVECIQRISKTLIGHVKKLKELKDKKVGAPTRVEGATPASTINFLAWEMLVSCNNNGIFPPEDLLHLVRLQLGVRSEKSIAVEHKREERRKYAAQYAYQNPDASFNEIARKVGVIRSTITRWNSETDIREQGKEIQAFREKSFQEGTDGLADEMEAMLPKPATPAQREKILQDVQKTKSFLANMLHINLPKE